jgi:hypothetical protein
MEPIVAPGYGPESHTDTSYYMCGTHAILRIVPTYALQAM